MHFQRDTISHEFGHAIGFQHEQTRPDRDNYVDVYVENIKPKYEYTLDKLSTERVNDFGVPYDYTSLMHYGAHVR